MYGVNRWLSDVVFVGYASNLDDTSIPRRRTRKGKSKSHGLLLLQREIGFVSLFASCSSPFLLNKLPYKQPELMVLANVKAQNENDPNIKFVDKNEDLELNPTMLSIHSSFVIANFQGLEAADVDIDSAAEDKNSSSLHLAYVDFVDELLAIVCPKEGDLYSECMDNPQFKYETAYDPATGQLCGSHAEYVRRIFCGEEGDRRERDLEVDHIVDNVVLYRVIDTLCPIPMLHQGEGKQNQY